MVNLYLNYSSHLTGVHHIVVDGTDREVNLSGSHLYSTIITSETDCINLMVYDEYVCERQKDICLWQRIISVFTLLFLCICLPIEKLSIPYRIRKKISVQIRNQATCNIYITENVHTELPQCKVELIGGNILEETMEMFADVQELNEMYKEKKRFLTIIGLGVTLICAGFALLSMLFQNYVTFGFLSFIVLLFLICFLYSFINLKRQWKILKNDKIFNV